MSTRWHRIGHYLKYMFPLWQYAPVAVAHFLAVYATIQVGAGQVPVRLGWRAAGGILTVFLYSLLLRLFDEMKDVESDRRLAESGDEWFRNRPLVTGAVLPSDLVWLRSMVLIALIVINVIMFHALVWAGCAALLALAWLSSKWFFVPGMRHNLLLALITHNPLALAIELYIVLIAVSEGLIASVDWWLVLLLVGLWLPITAWELSRKIRMPADETAYQTYSQVFGYRVAGILPAACTVVSACCLISVSIHARLGIGAVIVIGLTGALVAGKYLQFVIAPTANRAKLKPVASLYAAAANITLAVGAMLA